MRYLSNKDKKKLLQNIHSNYEIEKKDEIKISNENIVLKNNNPFLIKLEDDLYIPHLKSAEINFFPSIFIDHGAVPFLLNGADMMRPGIQKIEGEFQDKQIVIIREEEKGIALGVGISLLCDIDLKKQEKGKSVQVVHHMKDQFY